MQYMPGPEALLAPAMAQLAPALQKLINPNQEAQQALQMAVAKNPALLQELSDAEAMSPGIMQHLGFGNIGAAASSMPASASAQFEITHRAEIQKGREAALGAETAKSLYTSTNIQAAAKLMTENPGIAFDAALKQVTGETSAERVISQGKAEVSGAVTEAMRNDPEIRALAGKIGATGMTPEQIEKGKFNVQAMGHATRMMQEGIPITIDKFKSGEYTSEDLNAIFSTPMGDALKVRIDMEQDSIRLRISEANQGDDIKRLKMTQSFALFKDLRAGTLESAQSFLFDPGAADRAAELMADPTKAKTPQDIALLATGRQVKELDDTQRRVQISELGKNMMAYRAGFDATMRTTNQGGTPSKKGDGMRAMIVDNMNIALRQRALFGAPEYVVSYEEIKHWYGNKKELVYRDLKGVVVDEALVAQPILGAPPKPENKVPGTSADSTPPAPQMPAPPDSTPAPKVDPLTPGRSWLPPGTPSSFIPAPGSPPMEKPVDWAATLSKTPGPAAKVAAPLKKEVPGSSSWGGEGSGRKPVTTKVANRLDRMAASIATLSPGEKQAQIRIWIASAPTAEEKAALRAKFGVK